MATPSGGRPATGLPWTRSLPLLRSVRPAMQRSSVVLPQPDGPDDAHDFVALDRERQLMERDDRAVEEQLARAFRDDRGLTR